MASIQRIVSPLTNTIAYRVQVRVKGQPAQSETFPNRKEAEQWARSVEAAIREGRHFPHAAAKRTSFDALAKDYIDTVLADFGPKEKATRVRQLAWWSKQFSGLSLAEITADRISQARDKLLNETFTRGKPHKDRKTGELVLPKAFKRSGATVTFGFRRTSVGNRGHVAGFSMSGRVTASRKSRVSAVMHP